MNHAKAEIIDRKIEEDGLYDKVEYNDLQTRYRELVGQISWIGPIIFRMSARRAAVNSFPDGSDWHWMYCCFAKAVLQETSGVTLESSILTPELSGELEVIEEKVLSVSIYRDIVEAYERRFSEAVMRQSLFNLMKVFMDNTRDYTEVKWCKTYVFYLYFSASALICTACSIEDWAEVHIPVVSPKKNPKKQLTESLGKNLITDFMWYHRLDLSCPLSETARVLLAWLNPKAHTPEDPEPKVIRIPRWCKEVKRLNFETAKRQVIAALMPAAAVNEILNIPHPVFGVALTYDKSAVFSVRARVHVC